MLNQTDILNELEKIKQEIEIDGEIYEEKVHFKEPRDAGERHAMQGEMGEMQLHYYFPLTVDGARFRRVKIYIKKIIRKMNLFLFMPIIQEQNIYNERLCVEIDILKRELNDCKQQIEKLEGHVDR